MSFLKGNIPSTSPKRNHKPADILHNQLHKTKCDSACTNTCSQDLDSEHVTKQASARHDFN